MPTDPVRIFFLEMMDNTASIVVIVTICLIKKYDVRLMPMPINNASSVAYDLITPKIGEVFSYARNGSPV